MLTNVVSTLVNELKIKNYIIYNLFYIFLNLHNKYIF